MKRKLTILIAAVIILSACLAVPAFADGDVAGAVEETWIVARDQIRSVTDKVIFPVIDVILAILFFGKIATAYLDYRKHGQFDFVPSAILFACLVFSLTCPLYLWKILGM